MGSGSENGEIIDTSENPKHLGLDALILHLHSGGSVSFMDEYISYLADLYKESLPLREIMVGHTEVPMSWLLDGGSFIKKSFSLNDAYLDALHSFNASPRALIYSISFGLTTAFGLYLPSNDLFDGGVENSLAICDEYQLSVVGIPKVKNNFSIECATALDARLYNLCKNYLQNQNSCIQKIYLLEAPEDRHDDCMTSALFKN